MQIIVDKVCIFNIFLFFQVEIDKRQLSYSFLRQKSNRLKNLKNNNIKNRQPFIQNKIFAQEYHF